MVTKKSNKKKGKGKDIEVEILNIEEISFFRNNLSSFLSEKEMEFSSDNIHYKYDLDLGFDKEKVSEQEELAIFFEWEYAYQVESDKFLKVLELSIEVLFKVEGLKNEIIIKEEKIQMPDDLIQTIAGLTVSTARGILFTKSKGTILSNYFLPILNKIELMEKINSDRKNNNE